MVKADDFVLFEISYPNIICKARQSLNPFMQGKNVYVCTLLVFEKAPVNKKTVGGRNGIIG